MLPVELATLVSPLAFLPGGFLQRYVQLGAVLLLTAAGPLSAQLAPVGAPKGTLRVDFRGSFESVDQRIFGGRTEDYLADFGSAALGSDRLPGLRAADSLLSAILGQPGSRLNLGAQRANGQLTIGTGTIGAALGITRRLTLFGNIPLVTTRVQAHFKLDSTAANAGLNTALPGHVDNGAAVSFFTSFDNALTTLDNQITNGTYSGAQLALAQSISARASALRDQLRALTIDPGTATNFLPSHGSAAGQQILAQIQGLQDTLATSLSVSGFTSAPYLPTTRLNDADFASAIGDQLGPVAAFPLAESKIARMGDMDVGATYTFVDEFDRPGKTGGFRFAVSGLLRLPTGQRDNPNNFLDVGTGNGRYEAGVSGTADLSSRVWGARFTGGYLVRFAALRVRRLATPSEAYPDASRLTNIRFNAGDILTVGVQPYIRLARNLAILSQFEYQRVGSDRNAYDQPSDSIGGLNPNLLSLGSRSALAAGIGVTYVGRSPRECEPGKKCGWPVEASWNYLTVVQGSGDRVLKFRTTRLEIRWYQRIWR
jgi:hypothetical protein